MTPLSLSLPHSHSHYLPFTHNSPSSFHFSNHHSSILCLATSNKSRASRKLMSDDELRSVLREFVNTVGLPPGHVPSTKDLSNHGRKDLANVVRRRGHKLIKELLSDSAETPTDGFDSLENLNSDSNIISDHEETGQEGKLDDMVEEQMDIPVNDVDSVTGTSLVANDESAFSANGESPVSKEPAALTLQEKVENFMKYGQLETVEEDVYDDSNSNNGSTILNYGKQSLVDDERVIHNEGDIRHLARVSSDNVGQNGTLLLPRLTTPPEVEDKFLSYTSAQGTEDTDLDNNLQIEAAEKENEVEINRLKHLLHQKELELSRLKEEVEKEKQALLVLQTKAENEITKAQKLISEKDAELLAAEESLSGLVEAKIQYSGEGEMVEVSGSFNGWHQRVKMDPQPSSTMLGCVDSRKYRLWSTTLWLYPGTYEIKFIVDGHWKIDPQKEITSKGGVENNIL